MHQLIEKDFETKLQKLFAMSQFEIAVRLAKRQLRAGETSNDTLVEIYVAYGNQLYRKKSFDDAIRQYIKTIGFLEPSYVIRKFLDSQRIQNLTDYLQALHDHQLADKHHTTLLLNCYTKVGCSTVAAGLGGLNGLFSA
jgi:tetratricopeptide (TPR) repeat protein